MAWAFGIGCMPRNCQVARTLSFGRCIKLCSSTGAFGTATLDVRSRACRSLETEFWVPKLEGNRIRDRRSARALQRAGWKVLTVWECQTKKLEKLEQRVEGFLNA